MNTGPSPLIKSRKFWLLMLDTIISIVLYFTPRVVPGSEESVKFLIVTLQPVFIFLIGAYTYQNVKLSK